MDAVVLFDHDDLFVSATLTDDGDLRIAGQDLRHGEYEYFLTVRAADIPTVVAALGGHDPADLLALLVAHGEDIVHRGEKSWLNSLGIKPTFFSPS